MIDTIETDRFILRLVTREDNKNIFSILNNDNVITNLNMEKPKDLEDINKLINDYLEENKKLNKFPFAIINKNNNEFMGVFLIKLDLFDEDCFEFTVYINQKHWNKGIYTEVLPYMIKFAFEEIKTSNFRGFVMKKNTTSGKVLQKCGFKLEKVFKVDNIEEMIESYLITRSEYLQSMKK